MKRKILSALFLFILVSISCSNKPDNKVAAIVNDSIPEGAIPFEYDSKMLKLIILKGKINDSIAINLMFDTGGASGLFISDSLKSIVGDSCKLQIGKYSNQESISVIRNKNILRNLGSHGGIINWRFFEGKILRISFQNKFIQVYDNLTNVKDYDRIKIKKYQGFNFLILPVKIHLQGKIITEDLLFDTGSNSGVFLDNRLINKYGLKIDSALNGNTSMEKGTLNVFSLNIDSVGLDKYYVNEKNAIFSSFFKNHSLFFGFLGTRILENFDIILDLKNFVLYLKPNDSN